MTGFGRLLAVRPDEARLVGRMAILFATIEAARGVGEIGADTLVLGQLGAAALPYLYVVLGMLSLVAALAFGAAVGRLRRRPLFVAIFLVVAAVLVAERVVLVSGAASILPLMWLTVYVAGALIATLIWALAGWVFDARQAKRLFPLLASAAILGGAAGMLVAGPIAQIASADDLVLVQAGLLAIAAVLTADVSRSGKTSRKRSPTSSIVRELRVGADYVSGSSLMRLVAVAYVLFAVLLFSVSYPFLRAMRAAFPSEADLATALGLLSAAVTVLSFVVALALANCLYARFGIAVVVLALPVVYVAGFGVWLVRFTLATAVGFRFAQQVTQRGLSNAAWSAFYNVVPGERRAQVLAFMDGVPGQVGISLAGLLLLAAGTFLDQTATFVMGAVAAVAVLAVVLRIRRAYAASLVRTLRDGLAEQLLEGGPGLVTLTHDPEVVATLVAGLSEPNPGVRQLSAELLGRLGATEASDRLTGALRDPDPGVRLAASRALDSLGRPIDEAHIAQLAAGDDPRLRAEAALALERAGDPIRSGSILAALATSESATDRIAALAIVARSTATPPDACRAWVDRGLADPLADVRAAAIDAALSKNSGVLDPLPILVVGLDDPASSVRIAAARGLGARGAPGRERALDALANGSERAQEAALVALEYHGVEAHSELVGWALGQVDLALTARRQNDSLSGATDGEVLGFLRFVLGAREARIERRLAHVLAILSAPDDAALVERSLRSDDPETRAVAIEALDTMGDRRLAKAVVDLLEGEPEGRPSDTVETLRVLAGDPDPWVGRLAATVLAERGDPMPDTTGTLDGIERMLLLRRVPLFGRLEPEDLQRIAAGASEHLYPAGEAIVREGDPDDELVVIIDGTVRVVRADGTVIRSYGPGDHIGELAVLRERPRAATVVADPPAVRGLVISGIGLKAILRERPEAAMAMLATLAERLGTQ